MSWDASASQAEASKTRDFSVAAGAAMIMMDLIDEISPKTVYLRSWKRK